MNIYQLFVRTFGNKNKFSVFNGDRSQNGCGTFDDIDDAAINAIKSLGITHIWLTGVLRHSSSSSYPNLNIYANNPLVTKGKAGSPYSVMDYYDLDPDLAKNPSFRMSEFEYLVQRIHNHGLKLIIDFIPNHLAREYHSQNKPIHIEDFGKHDDNNLAFNRDNNFYYCPGQEFCSPMSMPEFSYKESPAKASGNDVFSPSPSKNDWYDTIKLNYGVDFQTNTNYFDPIPDTWYKMLDILRFWCQKGVDGFRVDMAEMVPVEFWRWVINMLRESFEPMMLAEIYQPHLYKDFIDAGFDYLYDKVGLYNTLENIYRYGCRADTITNVWKDLAGFGDVMLRFMENHDEIRLASNHFVGDAFKALPAVALAALMNRGPFMIYNGQESGEDACGSVGYSGDDGRTSIFDYVAMPKHQKWMSDGKFDGSDFSEDQKVLFSFYKKLLNFRLKSNAINKGAFYDLMWVNPWYSNFDPQYVYAFLRYFDEERLLVVINFNLNEDRYCQVKIPDDALDYMRISHDVDNTQKIAKDVFSGEEISYSLNDISSQGLGINLKPAEIKVLML